jgi:hypothetical protein
MVPIAHRHPVFLRAESASSGGVSDEDGGGGGGRKKKAGGRVKVTPRTRVVLASSRACVGTAGRR